MKGLTRPTREQFERNEAMRLRVDALLLQSRRVPVRQVFSLADEMKAASLPDRRLPEEAQALKRRLLRSQAKRAASGASPAA